MVVDIVFLVRRLSQDADQKWEARNTVEGKAVARAAGSLKKGTVETVQLHVTHRVHLCLAACTTVQLCPAYLKSVGGSIVIRYPAANCACAMQC